MRRERRPGGAELVRGGAGEGVEVQFHGDVGQDQPQREGAVPGAPQHGEEQKYVAAAGRQEEQVAKGHTQDQREVSRDVRSPRRSPRRVLAAGGPRGMWPNCDVPSSDSTDALPRTPPLPPVGRISVNIAIFRC